MILEEAANIRTEMHFSAGQHGGAILHRAEGPVCTLSHHASARGPTCKTFKSFGAESRFLKNWVFCNPNSAPPTLFSGPRVFAISTTFQAESRQDQNTKVVRLKSRNKAQVESRRTIQYRMRKARRRRLGPWFFRKKQGRDSSPNTSDSRTN